MTFLLNVHLEQKLANYSKAFRISDKFMYVPKD